MLRVRNEARWIERVVKAIQPICSQVYILDDHSTDATALICSDLGCVVIPSPFEELDESAEMQFLFEHAMAAKPDWIISIDGDEELEQGGAEKIRVAIETALPDVSYFTLKIVYLWDRADQVRVDGVYEDFRRKRIFKPQPGAAFLGNNTKHNLHCGGAGNIKKLSGRWEALDINLLHYGYLYAEDRMRKYLWHQQVEPNNVAEDFFRHIVQGDIPEVPANVKLKHAGPLVFRGL
jgi:glycosyltransferase involved in cell wall biosynthesis